MESTEEEFSSFTTKGRRTKRQRSLLAATASSSYRGNGGGAVVITTAGGGGGGGDCSDNNSYGSSSSGADDHDIMSEVTTTEEEDMANCLILLAQGIEKKVSKIIKSNSKTNNNNTSTSTSNIIGVYECKTCNKTFPSFQALGGHRTSHKKIKPSTPAAVRSLDTIDNHHDRDRDRNSHVFDDDLIDVMEFTSKKLFLLQPNNRNNNNMNMINHKARVHECSICGSEFPSGQALGGHMRRHRAGAPTTAAVAATLPSRPMSTAAVIDSGGPRNILSLDLNLPAPDDQDEQQIMVDDHMETKFVHVLPTPTPLVDCHY
ncbi:hypothetical protein SOVF_040970 [Spinacia oleracea]|uniref:Zinc finger protein ZAT5 n=1 Tax=Spinacia oleracea TaxID=3562 RepID=A0A9R0IFD0_SPIOL|nr:zinc finger protein ZAT5 [Spinacia oleracea]KNA21691.1 hypothetical protein SOVF_040970 [Spinacia oleracea]